MLVEVNIAELERARKKAGLSMHKLSLKSGLGKNAISKMTTETKKSSSIRVKAIAEVLNVDYRLLIKEDVSK